MVRSLAVSGCAAVIVAIGLASPAGAAALNRAFVSGHGVDAAGCGPPASPCRTFQYVHDNIVAANGEIDVLDAAGYGLLTITKAISIVNDGAGTAGIQAPNEGQTAITINAGSYDSVSLRGLTLDGMTGSGHGIIVNSAGFLSIANCVVRNFWGSAPGGGIFVVPSVGTLVLTITDTVVADNVNGGIMILPYGSANLNGMIKRSTITGNFGFGVLVSSRGVFGKGPTTGNVDVTIVDTAATRNNGLANFMVESNVGPTSAWMFLDHVSATDGTTGVAAANGGVARLTKSTITRNNTGVYFAGGTVESFQDNAIIGNFADFGQFGAMTPVGLK